MRLSIKQSAEATRTLQITCDPNKTMERFLIQILIITITIDIKPIGNL